MQLVVSAVSCCGKWLGVISGLSILLIKPTGCTNFWNLFWNKTPRVSDSSSVHHQQFFTVHTANLCDNIPLLCVQWKTPDDGQRNCSKHVEFYSKNKFEKPVHLVGFIIRIYHDARSPERQIRVFIAVLFRSLLPQSGLQMKTARFKNTAVCQTTLCTYKPGDSRQHNVCPPLEPLVSSGCVLFWICSVGVKQVPTLSRRARAYYHI